jgi:hypothetical protein
LVSHNSIAVTVVARQAYYDRTPASKTLFFNSNSVAPHSNTVRATYTTPTAKKAFITSGVFEMERSNVATTVGVTTLSSTAAALTLVNLISIDNTLGSYRVASPSGGHILNAAEAVNIADADQSTGGAMDISEALGIVEFDA